MGLFGLVLLLGCTLGESAPRTPEDVGREAGDEAPVERTASAEATARASELLDRAREAYGAAEIERALETATEVVAEFPATDSALPARLVAARSALALGNYEQALDLAEEARAAAEDPGLAAEADELAELAGDALAPPAPEPVVIGVVLPRTGPRVLVRYADWVLEGIELAVAEAERVQGRRIELVVADDSGGARVREAVASLERRGSLAIIGPLLPEHLMHAAGARRSDRLVLISPTATEAPRWRQSYSVNATDARGARELGRYATDLGLEQAAVLYPRADEYERKATAFAAAFRESGGRVRAMVPYDSGTTTFQPHMERILERVAPEEPTFPGDTVEQRPFALFVPAPQRDVPQIAPQVSFYGLDSAGVQIFGDAAWASAAVRRVVPKRDLEGVIAASHFPPNGGAALADSAFIRAYEQRYRRTLDNPLPAFGYDAAHLLLQAMPNRMLTPAALARRFQLLARIRGATGVLSVRDGEVVRIPYLVRIRRGDLVPAPFSWEYELPVPRPPKPDSVEGGIR